MPTAIPTIEGQMVTIDSDSQTLESQQAVYRGGLGCLAFLWNVAYLSCLVSYLWFEGFEGSSPLVWTITGAIGLVFAALFYRARRRHRAFGNVTFQMDAAFTRLGESLCGVIRIPTRHDCPDGATLTLTCSELEEDIVENVWERRFRVPVPFGPSINSDTVIPVSIPTPTDQPATGYRGQLSYVWYLRVEARADGMDLNEEFRVRLVESSDTNSDSVATRAASETQARWTPHDPRLKVAKGTDGSTEIAHSSWEDQRLLRKLFGRLVVLATFAIATGIGIAFNALLWIPFAVLSVTALLWLATILLFCVETRSARVSQEGIELRIERWNWTRVRRILATEVQDIRVESMSVLGLSGYSRVVADTRSSGALLLFPRIPNAARAEELRLSVTRALGRNSHRTDADSPSTSEKRRRRPLSSVPDSESQTSTPAHDELWAIHADWKSGRIRSGSIVGRFTAGCFAIAWNAIVWFILWAVAGEEPEAWWLTGLLWVGAIIGLLLAYGLIRSVFHTLRYGMAVFEMDSLPACLGDQLRGVIVLPRELDLAQGARLTLSCSKWRRVRISLGRSSGRSETIKSETIWTHSTEVDLLCIETAEGRTRVPVELEVPDHQPPTSFDKPNPWFEWQLCIDAKTPGVDLHEQFQIPVVARREDRTGTELPEGV